MTHISHKEFEILNWLPVTEKVNQCINSTVLTYVNDQCPHYLNEVFQTAPENNIQPRGSVKCQSVKSQVIKSSTHLNIIQKNIIQKNLKILILVSSF